MRRGLHLVGLGIGAAFAALLGAPPAAVACGGLVCSGGPLGAIDQANERVLFVLEDDGAAGTIVTAAIQIQYEGVAADFGWILPLPAVPETIEVGESDLFAELDAATTPTFRLPALPGRAAGAGEVGYFPPSCGGPPLVGITGDPSGTAREVFEQEPVNVWASGTVGPYEMAVISSAALAPLTDWVLRHGYNASDVLLERAGDYVRENFKFLVVRLRPEAGLDALAPLVVRYRSAGPCLPLRLTAIAARPDMGVRVYIVAAARAIPLNYEAVMLDETELIDQPGVLGDYDALVSRAVDAAGGRGWVTEFAGPVADAILNPGTGRAVTGATMRALLERGAWVTRLYTKISPDEMEVDPLFLLDPGGAPVDNFHALAPPGASEAGMLAGAESVAGALACSVLSLLALLRARLRARRADG